MPPVFSIKTPFMVFGIDSDVAIVLVTAGLCIWDCIAESRAVAAKMRGVCVEIRLMRDMQCISPESTKSGASNDIDLESVDEVL